MSKYELKSVSAFVAGAAAFALGVAWAFAPAALGRALAPAGVPAGAWGESAAQDVGAALGVALGVSLMHAAVATPKAAVTVICAGSSLLIAGAAEALAEGGAYPARNLGALVAALVAAAAYEHYGAGAKAAAPAAARVTRGAAKKA